MSHQKLRKLIGSEREGPRYHIYSRYYCSYATSAANVYTYPLDGQLSKEKNLHLADDLYFAGQGGHLHKTGITSFSQRPGLLPKFSKKHSRLSWIWETGLCCSAMKAQWRTDFLAYLLL